MTPSSQLSANSSASSRPSSSASNLASHETPASRYPLPSGPSPVHFASLRTDAMGAAGHVHTIASSESHSAAPQPRARHSRQRLDEPIHPSSSPSSSTALEELSTSTEHDTGTKSPGPGEPGPSRPKKKRTRTLTTPHQSAVLHALLAKSRFPTTAMREEVGRSIGLSARKVQVWFQNQRQKARRPHPQNIGSSNHPPESESSPSQGHPVTAPLTVPSSSSARTENILDTQRQYFPRAESLPVSTYASGSQSSFLEPQRQYSSPVDTEQNRTQYPPPVSSTSSYPSLGFPLPESSSSSSSRYSMPSTFPPPPSQISHLRSRTSPTTDPYQRRGFIPEPPVRRGSDPPIILPPLRLHGRHTLPPPPVHRAESIPGPGLPNPVPPPPSAHSSTGSNISVPSATSHHFPQPPFGSADASSSRHPESRIPAPFTLQPRPQWAPSAPVIESAPSSTAASREGWVSPPRYRGPPPELRPHRQRTTSDPARRLPPLSSLLGQDRPPHEARPWDPSNRMPTVPPPGRRFDPVHSVLRGEAWGSGGGGRGGRSRLTQSSPNPDVSERELQGQDDRDKE